MSGQNLSRLEGVISGIMRVGVVLSAIALVAGLVLTAFASPHAGVVLSTGLILLMCVPAARILASLGDALVRRDALLAVATAYVTAVLLWQFLKIF